MNVDEINSIRVVNLQKGKYKQDPGPMRATARMVKKQYSEGLGCPPLFSLRVECVS